MINDTHTLGPYTYGPDSYGNGTYHFSLDGEVQGDGIVSLEEARDACITSVEYDGFCPRCFEESDGEVFSDLVTTDDYCNRIPAFCPDSECRWMEEDF